MITFLPYPSFALSAAVLDNKRLGKQRPEAVWHLRQLNLYHNVRLQIPTYTISPRFVQLKMWKGYETALAVYAYAMCRQWELKGYNNNITAEYLLTHYPDEQELLQEDLTPEQLPPWLGNPLLHSSHRSQLLRKDPLFYSQYNWPELPAEQSGYYWPVP